MEQRPRLLIVEDDEDYRMVLLRAARQVTKDRGWEIACVSTLHEGEDELHAAHVNLILTDYRLPDGLGTALTAQTSRDQGRTQRVVLTGDPALVQRSWADEPTILDDVWDKGWSLDEIQNRLDAAMARVEFNRYWT